MTSERDHETKQHDGANEEANDFFGSCPVCGKNDGFLNVRREHWFVCGAHRTKWLVGENWFACWREQTPEEWEENARKLADFREVPYVS